MSNLDTSEPIVVHASPTAPQIAAGIRQVAAAAGVILAAFGASALAEKANIVVTLAPQIASILLVVGPLAWGAVTYVGQRVTRKRAQEAAAMAAQLPDRVAQTK